METGGPFRVLNHPAIEADLAALPRNMSERVVRAMEERLAAAPHQYGERLRRSLRGFWKLRVGDLRVLFEIAGREVRVYAVMDRREVYRRAAPRLLRGWPSPERGAS